MVHIIIDCIPLNWHFGMWYRWSGVDAVNNIPIEILAGTLLQLSLVGAKAKHKQPSNTTFRTIRAYLSHGVGGSTVSPLVEFSLVEFSLGGFVTLGSVESIGTRGVFEDCNTKQRYDSRTPCQLPNNTKRTKDKQRQTQQPL